MVALQQRQETNTDQRADATTRLLNRGIARVPDLDARLTTGARVLVLGCGDGDLIAQLRERYPLLICTGVEDDAAALESARARLGGDVTLIHGAPDAYEPGERAFDVVLAHFALARGCDLERLAANAFAALRRRGLFVVSDTRDLEGHDVAMLDRRLFWDVSSFNLAPEHRVVHGSR